jgi:serine protease AprX
MKTMGTPTRTDDRIASYSSKGPTVIDHIVKPDIVAPGNLVVSLLDPDTTLPETYPQTLIPKSYYESVGGNSDSNDYFRLNGTSMATPVVSGAAALLLQAQPGLTPDQVKARLMRSAYKTFPHTSQATDPVTGQVYVSQYDIFTIGAGYLDIQAALADWSWAIGNALSPSATYDSTTGDVNLVFAPGSVWGTWPIWSPGMVWGHAVVNGTETIWGCSVVWGQSGTEGFGTIWGAGTHWGQTTTEATSILVNGEN